MALGKRLINTGAAAAAACSTDSVQAFGADSAFSSNIALYQLDSDGGTTNNVPDTTTNYNGTASNVTYASGHIGNAAVFNGSSSEIEVSSNVLNINTISVSAWINLGTTSGFQQIVSNYAADNKGWGLRINDGGYLSYNTAVNVITSSTALLANTWHHVALTIDSSGNSTKLYINGSEDSSTTYTAPTYGAGNTNFHIGSLGNLNTQYFNGSIDQVRVFSKALNSTEVGTLFAEAPCVYECTTDDVNYPFSDGTNVEAYYKLDNSSEDYAGGNDGSDTNVEYRFGRFGQAAVFNGSSSYIDISNFPNSIFKDSTNGYTVSFWFKRESGTSSSLQAFFGTALQTKALNVYFRQSDNLFQIENGSGSAIDITGGFTYDDGNWHHFVLTDTKVYIDGSETMTYTGNYPSTFTDGQTFHIGSRHSASRLYYGGDIDQVRIYSTALTSSQVTELYEEKPCADTSNFKTVLFEGNGSTQYISNVGFEPDLVWWKNRDTAAWHQLHDSIRGAGNRLFSNDTSATQYDAQSIKSFDSNGFTIGTSSDFTGDCVAWVWKGGGDDVLNEEGTIDSQVSANTEAGFSIVSYTGNGTAGSKIGHGLDNPPELIIAKNRDESQAWIVNADVIGKSNILTFSSGAKLSRPNQYYYDWDSDTITLASDIHINGLNDKIIAYCWHSVAGYSKIGSYTGGGTTKRIYVDSNDDGTGTGGFKPSFVMIKASSSLGGNQAYGSWVIHDDKRAIESTDNVTNPLYANKSYQEGLRGNGSSGSGVLDLAFNDDGFTINHNGYEANGSGIAYIYMAFK
jgi:hypothetical protein